MFSIYETTQQGQQTRSQLLEVLQEQDGLTRNEIVKASNGTLTYEQVRRQTENLIFERQIYSQREETGRRYYLRQKFIQNVSKISVSCMVLALAWSVPVGMSNIPGTDDDDHSEKNPTELMVSRNCYSPHDRGSTATA
ncbi:hypothetical protein K9N68_06030 [Kovacikia minuta CCNUW1]|uniref:hypothetical protein n=1 Tax=Kovacikia minuta TaxID=2931930 RepID=UPI001CC9BCBC|nr:hypothetical protein [Kovacikia minuta]UBF27499.1 hypothetical protein K9N68_06030 [Kovacikia minuta CCNUW1]